MKKNLILFLIICIVLLGAVGCKQPDSDLQNIDAAFSPNRSDTPKEGTAESAAAIIPRISDNAVTLADQTTKALSFQESTYTTDDVQLDRYTDESGGSYSFDQFGTLVKYDNEKYATPTTNPTTTLEQAEAVARNHFKKTYGDFIDDYALETATDTDGCYHLSFVKKYGAEQFVKGELCFAEVSYSGEIIHSNTIHVGRHDNFDTALLDGLTEEKMRAFAEQQIAEQDDGNQFTKLKGVWLTQTEDGYELTLTVSTQNAKGFKVLKEYAYPLQ